MAPRGKALIAEMLDNRTAAGHVARHTPWDTDEHRLTNRRAPEHRNREEGGPRRPSSSPARGYCRIDSPRTSCTSHLPHDKRLLAWTVCDLLLGHDTAGVRTSISRPSRPRLFRSYPSASGARCWPGGDSPGGSDARAIGRAFWAVHRAWPPLVILQLSGASPQRPPPLARTPVRGVPRAGNHWSRPGRS